VVEAWDWVRCAVGLALRLGESEAGYRAIAVMGMWNYLHGNRGIGMGCYSLIYMRFKVGWKAGTR